MLVVRHAGVELGRGWVGFQTLIRTPIRHAAGTSTLTSRRVVWPGAAKAWGRQGLRKLEACRIRKPAAEEASPAGRSEDRAAVAEVMEQERRQATAERRAAAAALCTTTRCNQRVGAATVDLKLC